MLQLPRKMKYPVPNSGTDDITKMKRKWVGIYKTFFYKIGLHFLCMNDPCVQIKWLNPCAQSNVVVGRASMCCPLTHVHLSACNIVCCYF